MMRWRERDEVDRLEVNLWILKWRDGLDGNRIRVFIAIGGGRWDGGVERGG
jgi:hypothetical protein